MDLRTEQDIFVGYAFRYKGYRIFNPRTNSVTVVIRESIPTEEIKLRQPEAVQLSTVDNVDDITTESQESKGDAEPEVR